MAARGRPTPQAEMPESGPRYRERPPEDVGYLDTNPFLAAHREFGDELLPASEAQQWLGRWHERFGREAPLHLEIGSGNGFYLSGLAQARPDWDLIGLEIRYKRTVLVAKKLREAGVSNALITRYHAAFLSDLFTPGSLAGIHVCHPDPWPRTRQEKHRLISRWFLEDVASLLKPGGFFRLKSDFLPNVDRVPKLLATDGKGGEMPALPLRITRRSDDINANGPLWEDDIITNYQRKFIERGLPVYAIELERTA